MTALLIKNGRVLDPAQGVDATRDVLVRDGRIAELSSLREGEALEIIDAAGQWVMPGFIDLHTHLREPGQEGKETIQSGCRSAVAGGFTAVVAMPNTVPVIDTAVLAKFVAQKGRDVGLCRVYPSGSITRGQEGKALTDMADLVSAGCVCLTDDGRPVTDAGLMRRAIQWAMPLGVPLMLHEEELSLSEGGFMNEGPVAARLGLLPIPASAEVTMVARDLVLAEETGGRLHFAHLSCEQSVRLVREGKRRGLQITAEATPHHFTLTDEALEGWNTDARMNPPLRSARDVEAVQEGLADGTIDAIATDHAPHGVADKVCPFDCSANGIVGLETALPLTMELVHAGKLSPMRAAERLSMGPARAFRLPGGSLKAGEPADVTLVDPSAEWAIESKRFFSKSRNSPFEGRRVKGRVRATIVGGRVVFMDGAVKEQG